MVAYVGAAEILVEWRHGFFGADMAKDAFRIQRLAFAFGRAVEFHLDVIAILDNAAFNRSKRSGALAHLLQSLIQGLVGDAHIGHFDFERFVIGERKFGKNFKACAEFDRLAFVELQLVDLRLRNGRELLFGYGLLDVLRHELL